MIQPLLEQYRPLAERVLALSHLEPSEKVNSAFHRLVSFTQQSCDDRIATEFLGNGFVQSTLPALQKTAAHAETLLEFHWAERFRGVSLEGMKSFPYFANYEALLQQEIACLQMVTNPGRILFVGAGPLPLSPLLFHRAWNKKVTCVDLLPEACKFHTHDGMDCICADIRDMHDFSQYEVIVLAALVGESALEKEHVLRHIIERMHSGQVLLIRQSEGLKQILYASIPCEVVRSLGNVAFLLHYAPEGEVINATSLFRKL